MDVTEAPVFFIKGKKGECILVNYRLVRNYFIIDRVFSEGELRCGDDKVRIKKL
jgi:type IV secretion system protein VirB9